MNNNFRIAQRMCEIQSFHAMDLFARARQMEEAGDPIIHLEVGEPDFDTPEPVLVAGIQALHSRCTHYTPALGLMQLRETISGFYAQRYGLDVPASRIVITPGASGGLLLTLGILVSPGDTILMSDPGYPANRHFVRMYEGYARSIPVDESTNFQLRLNLIQENWDDSCAGVMLASPSNPTGTLMNHTELVAIAEFVRESGGVLIVDEIYHGLVYDGDVDSAANLGENVFVINSFSKYFGMTGWRLGWVVAPKEYVPQLDKLAQNIVLAASTPAQYAALAAFRPESLEILETRKDIFRQRRDFLLAELETLGFKVTARPQGAFYIYADCAALTDDSFRLVHDLLSKAHLAMTPGVDFGTHESNRHIRIAYTASMEILYEAIERLVRYFRTAG